MRAIRKFGLSWKCLGLLAMAAALGVLSLPAPGHAQSGSFCRWEPVGDNPTTGAYVCDNQAGPPGPRIQPDPCFAQLNAMRPCTPAPRRRSADTFAAIAISPTSMETGTSWGAGSQAEAERIAMQYCAKQGNNKDCEVLRWARNACVAIAVSHGTGHNDGVWGYSWNVSRSAAKAAALSACKNKDCKIQQSACSSDR